MEKSVKAVLLSAVLYPGAGHIFLKAKVLGVLFIALFTLPLVFVLEAIISATQYITEKVVRGEISADYQTISNAVHQQLAQSANGQITALTYALIVIWLIAIIDSWRLSKKLNENSH